MRAKREEWSGFAKKPQASHLVFLDESGVNINMARRYGRGKDDRCVFGELLFVQQIGILLPLQFRNFQRCHSLLHCQPHRIHEALERS